MGDHHAAAVTLDDVLITDRLRDRPSRPPEHAAENRALAELARALVEDPDSLLRKLADLVLELCRADSAGISIAEQEVGPPSFRWPAVVGVWADLAGGSMPRDASPCGVVIDRDGLLLFDRPGRHFADVAAMTPKLLETLLAPFHVDGRPVGTVWANAHTPGREFDAEDARLLTSLSRFAAASYQMTAALRAEQEARARLEERVRERTADLTRANQALGVSEGKYRTLFEAMDEGFCIVEVLFDAGGRPADYRFVEVNAAFERHTGLHDAAGRRMRDLRPDHDAHWFETYGAIARTGEPRRFLDYSESLGRWFDVYAFRVGDPAARRVAILFNDITERERAGRDLRASEARLRALVTASSYAIYRMSPDWSEMRELDGRGFLPDTGRPSSSWLDTYIHPDDQAMVTATIREAIRSRSAFELEHRVRRADGTLGWTLSRAVPFLDEAGRVAEWFGAASDVTGRRRAEEALRASEGRLQLALTAARMGIWTLDVASGAHMRDANLNRLLGLEPAETVQAFDEFLQRIIHPDDRPAVAAAFDASIRDALPLNVEFRVVRPDGSVRWLRDQGDGLGGASGGSRPLAGACVDVTERREAEQALRDSEERLRLIVESATDYAILTQDPGRTVTSWSPGATAAFGYDEPEMVGRSGDILYTPEDRAAGVPEAEARTARREGRAADERWHMRRGGSRFYASGVTTPLGAGGSLGFVKVLRDLTDRKRMEDDLRRARDELELRVAERTAALQGEIARRMDLTRRLARAQEEERHRISRDLHDSVGQLLAGLSLAYKAVETAGELSPPAAARLGRANEIVDALGKEMHDLAVRLRPTSLDDLGLEPALEQLVAEWSTRAGLRADFHAAGLGPGRLAPEVETTLYRVIQEALTNIAKHARASIVSVVVARPDGFVNAVVEDDGRGFDPEAAPKGRLGLVGMRERVALADGVMEVESAPGSGTTVYVRIPIRAGEGGGS